MMDSANLPSQTDLNSLYGAWNPMSYMQGFQNQSIADQFRQQAFQGNDLANQKSQQALDQDTLMNPERLRHIQGTNQGQEYKNTVEGIAATRAKASEGFNLSEDLRQQAITMSADDFKQADQHIERLLRSQDPKEQAMGLKLQSTLPAMLAEKRKDDQAMAIQREQTRAHLGGAQITADASTHNMDASIEAGRYAPKGAAGLSFTQNILKEKVSERLGTLAAITETGINPMTKEPLSPVEMAFYKHMFEQDINTADGRNFLASQKLTTQVDPTTGEIKLVNTKFKSVHPEEEKQLSPDEMRAALKNGG